MATPPPAKRPREEIEVVRSKIWYSDGSVVLQAENTQFCVHSSILAARSTVFRDMFALPQPSGGDDSRVDGLPLVHLFDDKAQDVELVLDALYDWNFRHKPQQNFVQVAAMWRLGKKYEINDLRNDAQRRLEGCYPSTLTEFQNRFHRKSMQPFPIITYPGFNIDVVNFARETGFLSVLPAALYRCNHPKFQRFIHERVLLGTPGANDRRFHLSDSDKAFCVLATSELLKRQWEGAYRWVADLGSVANIMECSSYDDCYEVADMVKTRLLGPNPEILVLEPGMQGKAELCAKCRQSTHAVFVEEQKRLWQDLPSVYGLPSWDEIRQEMARISAPTVV